jgi:hypothetical protein
MADHPLTYLIERFSTDERTLLARAQQLGATVPSHGPDGAASRRMAEACAVVRTRLEGLAAESDSASLAALERLAPELEAQARRAPDQFVRSVYGGAATRVAEIVARTLAAQSAALDDAAEGAADDEPVDDAIDDAFSDDELDDDELDDALDDALDGDPIA